MCPAPSTYQPSVTGVTVGRKRGRPRKISDDSYTPSSASLNTHSRNLLAAQTLATSSTTGNRDLINGTSIPLYSTDYSHFGAIFDNSPFLPPLQSKDSENFHDAQVSSNAILGKEIPYEKKSLLRSKQLKCRDLQSTKRAEDVVSAVVEDIHQEYSLKNASASEATRKSCLTDQHTSTELQTLPPDDNNSLGRCLEVLAKNCNYENLCVLWNSSSAMSTSPDESWVVPKEVEAKVSYNSASFPAAERKSESISEMHVDSLQSDSRCILGSSFESPLHDAIIPSISASVPSSEKQVHSDTQQFKIGRCGVHRKSYTREEKLHVLDWYNKHGKNKYRTCKIFGLNTRMLGKWVKAEEKIRCSRRGAMKVGSGRKPFWKDMEDELYLQYLEQVGRSRKKAKNSSNRLS